jgi:hypothetical protein
LFNDTEVCMITYKNVCIFINICTLYIFLLNILINFLINVIYSCIYYDIILITGLKY